ncbi:hypothetical protein Godav_027008 [Gossypium davidsonii]|uniref:CCHC-type domain-containing protein n=1 Tax=Gossypium davidsonii TaxID=34287 RepID=A0A7J8RVC2_GOSDV|nr:hypothetical protein [Gossypium davidsonii]
MLSSHSVSNVDNNEEGDSLSEDSNTTKVRFKESDVIPEDVMVVESSPTPSFSSKDMLVGKDSFVQNNTNGGQFLGPWVIFGHYLTVQPWMIDFNPSLPYPNMVLIWIRFPGLPSHLYQKQILMEIRGIVGKVIKLDFNMDSRAQGRYARMEDYVNLGRLLVSKILINGSPQRIEYENLLVVCFKCGCYGHIKENCRSVTYCSKAKEKGETLEQTSSTSMVAEDGDYGLEASSTDEELIKENQRYLKKKGKATLNDPQEKFLTGKKSTINNSKRVDLGLSVGKLFNGQARDPKTNILSKDYIKVGSKTGLIPQAYLAANQQAHLDTNQQTSSSYGFGQQQETQASKEARTDLSKLPSVTHVSLPSTGENNQSLNSVVFKNSSIMEPVSEEIGGNGCPSEIKLPREVLKGQNANAKRCMFDKFLRAFREYNNQYKPDIISLIKPRISGVKADTIIAKLGMDKSYRVEAVVFSSGI